MSGSPGICPNCGHDLAAGQPIASDELAIGTDGRVTWFGKPVHLPKGPRTVLRSIVQAGGRPLSAYLMADALGYEGDYVTALVNTHVKRIRQALPGVPIETVSHEGYRWAPPAKRYEDIVPC